MNCKLTALVLSGALVCALSVQSLAAETVSPVCTAVEEDQKKGGESDMEARLPNAAICRGTVREIARGEGGQVQRLILDSERHGPYVMNCSEGTVWIDGASRTADLPGNLRTGELVSVFYGPMVTLSLPPQAPALAVVRNVAQDGGCASYHQVEQVEGLENGGVRITTDHGGQILTVSRAAAVRDYKTGEMAELSRIQVGDRVVAWYAMAPESDPARADADAVLVLPRMGRGRESR